MALITVEEAQELILAQVRDFGSEKVDLLRCYGRVLSEDIYADRDLPPYDRVTMDGIALRFEDVIAGIDNFRVAGTMAAGDKPIEITTPGECVEIMTGCALPSSLDTVVRYEDVVLSEGKASLSVPPSKKGANVHYRASDKKKGDVVLRQGQMIGAAEVSMLASVGQSSVSVKRLPGVAVISTGNELVAVNEEPSAQQVRRSNTWVVASLITSLGASVQKAHLLDDEAEARDVISVLMDFNDVLIMSGGVSMGKFDVMPGVLKTLGFTEVFHKVKQRPGKPFWFGTHTERNKVVFAFPGNPVSSFLCLYRYFLPWFRACSGVSSEKKLLATLVEDVTFAPDLQYFLPVKLEYDSSANLKARPVYGNGSGDFSVLLESDAFIELPAKLDSFRRGEVFPVWPIKNNLY